MIIKNYLFLNYKKLSNPTQILESLQHRIQVFIQEEVYYQKLLKIDLFV